MVRRPRQVLVLVMVAASANGHKCVRVVNVTDCPYWLSEIVWHHSEYEHTDAVLCARGSMELGL